MFTPREYDIKELGKTTTVTSWMDPANDGLLVSSGCSIELCLYSLEFLDSPYWGADKLYCMYLLSSLCAALQQLNS